MLDAYIKERINLISYSQDELNNIASTLSHLKVLINNEKDFSEPVLGGSYKRGTMVKGISDVDVYFEYKGTGNAKIALIKLKQALLNNYPTTEIKPDEPSILANFQKIPINITPYKRGTNTAMSIPDEYLENWNLIDLNKLEVNIKTLTTKSHTYLDLIKILKLWNTSRNKPMKNYDIENRVYNLFFQDNILPTSISDCMIRFLNNNGYNSDANKLISIKKKQHNESSIKSEWLKFIENK